MKISLHLALITFLLIKCTPPNEKKSFEDKKGDFSIEFYMEPTEETQKVMFPFGTFSGYKFLVDKPDDSNESYSVFYVNLPGAVIHSDSLRRLTDFFTFTQADNFRTLGENNLNNIWYKKVKGYPGREYVWADPANGIMLTRRVFLVANRLYVLEVKNNFSNVHNKKISAFLDSFKLLTRKANTHLEPEAERPERKFSVTFPGKPMKREEISAGPFGPQFLKVEMYQPNNGQDSDDHMNIAYGVIYTCFPKDSMATRTDQQKHDYIKFLNKNNPILKNGGTILSEEEGEFCGFWCLSSTSEILGGSIAMETKTFFAGNYQYTVMVMSKAGFNGNSAASDFFKTFKLK